jgi:hypothetical protein
MTRKRSALKKEPAPLLGPGLHGAVIELSVGQAYEVRTTSGARLRAVLDDAVDPALAADCLRTGRMVILADSPRGPAIMGALQTSVPIARDADGVLTVEARELRLRAERAALLEVGHVALSADASGAMRIDGDRLVIDMAALVRVLSMKVELP